MTTLTTPQYNNIRDSIKKTHTSLKKALSASNEPSTIYEITRRMKEARKDLRELDNLKVSTGFDIDTTNDYDFRDYSFIYYSKPMFSSSAHWASTSELGALSNTDGWENELHVALLQNYQTDDNRSEASHYNVSKTAPWNSLNPDDHMKLERMPSLVQPNPRIWIPWCDAYSRFTTTSSNDYNYSPRHHYWVALKNTTGVDINVSTDFYGTAYGSYSLTGCASFTPNNTNANKALISDYTPAIVATDTSDLGTTNLTGVILVPAGTTVLVGFTHAEYYYRYDSSYDYVSYKNFFRIDNIKDNMFPAGIELDTDVMRNFLDRKIQSGITGLWTGV